MWCRNVIILASLVTYCSCLDILQLFGRRLQSKPRTVPRDFRGAEKLMQGFGYSGETHEVITEDGYILALHRLPYGRNQKVAKHKRPVVLLFGGFASSSDCFLYKGPELDLPYLLADAGYDMWLTNARGNYNSRRHLTLNPDTDREFWDFSCQESAVHDLSSSIDYILEETGQEDLFFIGYSLSCAFGMILCVEKPEYNAKIRLFINMAPFVYEAGKRHPIVDLAFKYLSIATKVLNGSNILELWPSRRALTNLIGIVCKDGSPFQGICVNSIMMFTGFNYAQFNASMIPSLIKYYPAGSSLNTVLQGIQFYTTGHFRPLTYTPETNRLKYGRNIPADYDVGKVTAPTVIYYGDGDFVVTKQNCEVLREKLPNFVGLFRVPDKNFNHLDFMLASNAKSVLYDHMILLMNKYR